MLKYYDTAITFNEFPDEIALCLNITKCPCKCEGCSEKYLQEDIGINLTYNEIDGLVDRYKEYGITLIGFMGGDSDHQEILKLTRYIKEKFQLKVGFYSGLDYINLKLVSYLDYYKYGKFILPVGDEKRWCKQTCGPISFPFSNQKIYKINGDRMIDITYRFRQQPINNYKRHII